MRDAYGESTSGSPFRQALRTQLRVVGALLMREIITRYGRHNVGFLWLMLEPILFTTGVTVLWNMMHRAHGLRVEVTPFIVTGYASLLLWRNCSSRGLKAIEPNRSLLHHRNVKIQDIFIARMTLEVAGVTAAFIVLLVTVVMLGLMDVPRDMALLLAGWLFMAWFSVCLGTILGCWSEYSDIVERLWHPVSYFLLFGSGTFYMVDWLPKAMQRVVMWVPMVHPVEMMRAGYWGNSARFHFDAWYILSVCLVMSVVALLSMADRRLKMMT